MAFEIECAVIGAGVIGLAVGREMALRGHDVVLLEAADVIGSATSSRNSEVIHAGIYYAKDSLKAELCVAGKHYLYDYCKSHGVAHRACGKLIVATSAGEVETLASIRERAAANGVEDLEILSAEKLRQLEPELACHAALLSPSTGIIDSHALMLSYQGEAEEHGAMIAFNARVVAGRVRNAGLTLSVAGLDGDVTSLSCRQVINSAGLKAQSLARAIDGLPAQTVPPEFYCKGNYFSLTGPAPFAHLIYPVPREAGLGVHLTLDMAGSARFGPDQEWIEEIDYDVDPARAELFYAAVRTYFPALADGALQPDYAGIRPKVQKPGGQAEDFVIHGPAQHGVAGLVNLYGIESPGLTASLAIAEHVADLLA